MIVYLLVVRYFICVVFVFACFPDDNNVPNFKVLESSQANKDGILLQAKSDSETKETPKAYAARQDSESKSTILLSPAFIGKGLGFHIIQGASIGVDLL